MKNFIENFLEIKNYEIKYFITGRNNITCLVNYLNNRIIIQKEDKQFPKNQELLIEKLILNGKEINLAQNHLSKRFFEFNGDYYQVMNYIESINLDENTLEKESILSMFRYLALFHNMSEKINVDDDIKNIGKTFKSVEEYLVKSELLNNVNNKFRDVFSKIVLIKNNLNIVEGNDIGLKSGIIHGDPAFKNFIFDENKNALSLIDYEKVEYNNFIWDLADLIRSLLKVDKFDNELLKLSIKEYDKNRKLNNIEKNKLRNFVETLVFHVILQYFLALFPESEVNNMIGDEKDTLKKLERGFFELEKINTFEI